MISVIIPVYREQAQVTTCINNVCDALGSVAYEVIVVDGEGSTLEAIDNPAVVKLSSDKGRAQQMNAGAKEATGEVLLFLHADTRLPLSEGGNDTGSMIYNCLQKHEAGAFSLKIDSASLALRIIAGVASWRSRTFATPYGDQAIFLRRQYFESLGGYDDVPLLEDLLLMKALKRIGGKVCILSAYVSTSARRWQEEGVLRRTLKNWCLLLRHACGASPKSLADMYKRHRD